MSSRTVSLNLPVVTNLAAAHPDTKGATHPLPCPEEMVDAILHSCSYSTELLLGA